MRAARSRANAFRIARKAGDGVLIEGDEITCFAFNHNLLDAAGRAGHNGRAAGHGFKVDDAERLVNRGAAEEAAVGVKLDGLLLGDHLLDPHDAGVMRASRVDFGAQLGGNLRGVRRAGAEHHLRLRRQVADGVDQMRDAFLARDAANEKNVRLGRVDAVFDERLRVGGLLIFVEIDAVVDDVDTGGIDLGVGAEDVGPGALRDGDDRRRRRGWRCAPSTSSWRSRSRAARPSRRARAQASEW